MKVLLGYVAVAALCLLPSCALLSGGRDKLAEMSEPDYRALVTNVYSTAVKGGELLSAELEKPEDVELARQTLVVLNNTVMSDDLSHVDDLVRALLTRFGERLGNEKVLELLKNATNLIDAAVGQMKLGIDGQLTLREKALLSNLLRGVHDGL